MRFVRHSKFPNKQNTRQMYTLSHTICVPEHIQITLFEFCRINVCYLFDECIQEQNKHYFPVNGLLPRLNFLII